MNKKALLIKVIALALSLLMLSACGEEPKKGSDKKENSVSNEEVLTDDELLTEDEDAQSRPWQTYISTDDMGFEFGGYEDESTDDSSSPSTNSPSTNSSPSETKPSDEVKKPVIPYTKADLLKLISYLTYETDNYAIGIHGYGKLDVAARLENFKERTGKYSVFFDFDMNDLPFKTSERELNNVVQELAEFASKGGFIAITDHWISPKVNYEELTNGNAANSRDPKLTIEEFYEVMQEGTELNKNFMAELAFKVEFLKKLKEYNIPVIYRPAHEGNAWWFWWGTQPDIDIYGEDVAKLYRYVHDYFTKTCGLDNILWQMCDGLAGNTVDYSWYPGDNYVDLISNDWYMDITENTTGVAYKYGTHYEGSKEYGNGKIPYAVSELGGDATYDETSLPLKQTLSAVEAQIAKGYKTAYVGIYWDLTKEQDCTLPNNAITLDAISGYWKNALK